MIWAASLVEAGFIEPDDIPSLRAGLLQLYAWNRHFQICKCVLRTRLTGAVIQMPREGLSHIPAFPVLVIPTSVEGFRIIAFLIAEKPVGISQQDFSFTLSITKLEPEPL